MSAKDLSELTDQELLDEAKKVKSNAIINAALIGVMVGVVIYGVAKNNLGLVALIPLIIAFKLFNKPNQNEAVWKTALRAKLEIKGCWFETTPNASLGR